MKKLLLTIFAIAALVACDKDAYDMADATNINVIEAEVQNIDASMVFDILREANGFSVKEALKSNSSHTARSTTLSNDCADGRTDRTGDRLDVSLVPHASGLHAVIRSEDELPLTGSPAASFSLIKNGNTINILVGTTPSGSFPTNSGMDFLFGIADLLDISRVDNELFVLQANIAAADLGLDCSPIQGLYDLTPAPFPLNGWLATITDAAGFTGNSANYAGTTEADVRAAIEADIMDGN